MQVFILSIFLALSLEKALSTFEARIIGGNTAYAGQYPFAAAITIQTNNSKFFCGGTLIDSQWILTAGQCVDGATLFTIQLGSNNLKDDDPNRVILSSSEYTLHPSYNSTTLENDIALIKLRMPVEFSGYLKKVDFLGTHNVVDGTILLAIGWGQTSDNDSEFSNDLLWIEVTALSESDCRLVYGNQINSNTICVEGNYNEGSCYVISEGDTGNALLQDLGRGYKMIVGIASFISGNGCESTDPSGYIRIYPYRDWIREVSGV